MNTEGVVVASTDADEIRESEAADEYFLRGLKGVSSIELRGETHFGLTDSFVVSAPIIDRETGKVLGVIANFFKTEKLTDVLSGEFQIQKGAPTGRSGFETLEIYLVDKEKRMFVHPSSHHEWHGHGEEMIVNTEPVSQCLDGQKETLETYRNYAGEEVLGASMCFLKQGWTLLVEVHKDEAFAALNRIWVLFGITSAIFLALAFALAIFFGRRISDPIKKLHEGTEIIGGGKLNYRLDIKTGDELEQLAGAFNEMAINLQTRTQEAEEERARLVASINSLSLGFMLMSKDEEIILHNTAAMLMLELKEQEFNLKNIAEKLKGAFNLQERCAECIAKGGSVDQKDIPFKDRFLRIFLAPVVLLMDHKEIIGAVILMEDITEAKIMERSREEFFAIASHELRTPLTAIRGNMALLKQFFSESLKPEAVEMIEDSYGASLRLIGIVNDFLDVSRLEQSNVEFKKEKIDVLELIKEVVKEMSALADSKKLSISIKDSKTAPLLALSDRDRTKQVIYNLISNAINYTQKGEVRIEVKKDDKFLKIFVLDTGFGIAAQNQKLLFRKFQQAGERVLARDISKGTGLGLYISKLIVEAMGGKIWLEKSELGKGSIFAFALPEAV